MTNQPVLLSAALPESKRLISQGQHQAALQLLADALAQSPEHAEAHFLTAISLQSLGRIPEAQTYARKAVRYDNASALNHSLAADLAEELGSLPEAETLYRDALKLDANFAPAWKGLATVMYRKKQFLDAKKYFSRAIELNPQASHYRHGLANTLFSLREFEAALPHLQALLLAQPQSVSGWRLLGQVRGQLGDLPGAEACFVKALQISPSDAESSYLLGNVFHLRGEYEAALEAMNHAVTSAPATNYYQVAYGELLCKCGEVDAGRQMLARALQSDQRNLKIRMAGSLALPGIYRSRHHLAEARKDHLRGLENLLANAPTYAGYPLPSIISGLGWSNFILAYQGEDDLRPQKLLAALHLALLKPNAPDLYQPRPKQSVARKKLRVGFASSFFFDHTVGWYFQSWITGLKRTDFEIFVYHLNPARDWLTATIHECADAFNACSGMPTLDLARKISSDDLDLLIYPELGMCPTSYMLAGMRLARVQASGWGHPVTSGHENMDIRFSVTEMEPEGAETHYSETLVKLSGLGTSYTLPAPVVKRTRTELGLPDGKTLLVVPQSLFKIHPDNDQLYLQLLDNLPNADLVFFEDLFPQNTREFKARLTVHASASSQVLNRCIFLPRTDRGTFRAVLASADIMLDTLHWSGGNTSLDSIAAGLPIVTLPGKFMRGRQSLAMLKRMGIQDYLVAHDPEDYVRKVTNLASDRELRQALSKRISAGKEVLFEDRGAIDELQSNIKQICSDKSIRD